jgi:mannose-6-phosphate isomerase
MYQQGYWPSFWASSREFIEYYVEKSLKISHSKDRLVIDSPFQLLPIFRDRVWGRWDLSPFFQNEISGQPVGEVWFTFEENRTSLGPSLGELIAVHPEILGSGVEKRYPGICPLLVKLLFTTSRLSVQVHPDDDYATAHHESLGKTEAWYVLDAQPPGEIAVGFRETITPDRLREAAQSGEIEALLDWRKVEPGDIIFVPAGTVHAIGAGLTICEIQQNSDVTYRLYDYGRPRELHLDHGCHVSRLGSHNDERSAVALAHWRDHLVDCEYFRIERLRPRTSIQVEGRQPHYLLLVCVSGSGIIAGQPFAHGQTWMVPAGNAEFQIEGSESEWILAYAANEAASGLHSD